MSVSDRRRAIVPQLALMAATMMWGASFTVTKSALAHSGPLWLIALRFAVAAGILCLFLPSGRRSPTSAEWKAAPILAVLMLIGYAAPALAMSQASSARVAFLSALYVPLVPLLQMLTHRHLPGWNVIAGTSLAVAGIAIMSGIGPASTATPVADAWSFASAFAIAGEILLLAKVARFADPLRLATLLLGMTALLASCAAISTGEALPDLGPELGAAVLLLGGATAAIQVAMNWAQRHVPPARATVIYAGEPMWAALFGWLAGEALAGRDILGGIFIVVAILVGSLLPARRTPSLQQGSFA